MQVVPLLLVSLRHSLCFSPLWLWHSPSPVIFPASSIAAMGLGRSKSPRGNRGHGERGCSCSGGTWGHPGITCAEMRAPGQPFLLLLAGCPSLALALLSSAGDEGCDDGFVLPISQLGLPSWGGGGSEPQETPGGAL